MSEQKSLTVLNGERESYPEATTSDAGVAVLRSAISVAPFVGGAANELLSLVLVAPLEKRKEKWIRAVAADVDALIKKVDGMSWELLGKNEQFVTATIHATRIAMATHRGDKHRYLRNVLVCVAAGKGTSEEMWGSYFRLIEDFGAPHMQLLRLFGNDERRQRSGHCFTYAQYIREGLGKAARNPYWYLYPLALIDLNTRGLISIRDMEQKFATDDIVTYYGRRFMDFIADYEPEVQSAAGQTGTI
jgi:hypothetical protein